MADKLLKIDLHIDASNARVANAAIRADLRRTEVEAGKLALAQEREAKKGADAQVREQRRVTATTEAEAKKQAEATKKAAMEQADAARESSEQMMATLRGVGAVGLAALTAAGKATLAVMQEGIQKSRELSQDVIRQRDALRDIAAIAGKSGVGDVFLKENLDFRAQTGLTGTEAHSFREEFIGSGELSRGKTITDAEYGKYERQLARFAVAKKSDVGTVGEFGGSVLRFKDYTKGGSREAMADIGIAYDTLARGKGKQGPLQAQLSKLASAYVNEDELKGSYKDVGDAAAAISIGAEVSPESPADVAMQALRGLRSFHKKQGASLRGMGIKHGESFDVSMEKLSARLDKETAGGTPAAEAMEKMGFGQFEEQRSLLAFYNRRDLYKDQLDFARTNRDPAKVESDVDAAYRDKAIRDRQAQQRVEREQALKAISGEELVILRKDVRADLERDHLIGTPQADATNYMAGLMGGSVLAGAGGKEYGEQLLIDKEVRRRLGSRVPGSGARDTLGPALAGAAFGMMPGVGPVANAAGAWGDQFIRRSMGEDEANLQEGANTAAGGGLNQATQQRQLDVLERIERNTGGATAPLPVAPRGNRPTAPR